MYKRLFNNQFLAVRPGVFSTFNSVCISKRFVHSHPRYSRNTLVARISAPNTAFLNRISQYLSDKGIVCCPWPSRFKNLLCPSVGSEAVKVKVNLTYFTAPGQFGEWSLQGNPLIPPNPVQTIIRYAQRPFCRLTGLPSHIIRKATPDLSRLASPPFFMLTFPR